MQERTDLPERSAADVSAGAKPWGGPGEERRGDPARVAVLLIAIVVLTAAVTYLGPILKPFLVAVFLYFATKAGADFLIRLGFPTMLAYLTLFGVGAAAAAALALFAYGEVIAFRAEWPRYQERILDLFGKAPVQTGRPLAEMFTVSAKEVFRYVFEQSMVVVELLTMTFFYLLFIILGAGRMPQRVRRAFPDGRGEHILAVAGEIGAGVERFIRVKTLVSIGMGATAAALMYAFGLRGWLLWGILFFAFNYITYIGSFVACAPPVLVAYLDLSNPVTATVLSALVVLNRFVWVDYVEIRLSGKQLNIDSILLFLWLAYWGWVWGVIGLILAFPMAASLKIVLENLESTRGWAVLMSEE